MIQYTTGHWPAFKSSRSSSLMIVRLISTGGAALTLSVRRRLMCFAEDDVSAAFRSISATSWEKERNKTSACASVLSSSIDMLSSLQYCDQMQLAQRQMTGCRKSYLQDLIELNGESRISGVHCGMSMHVPPRDTGE